MHWWAGQRERQADEKQADCTLSGRPGVGSSLLTPRSGAERKSRVRRPTDEPPGRHRASPQELAQEAPSSPLLCALVTGSAPCPTLLFVADLALPARSTRSRRGFRALRGGCFPGPRRLRHGAEPCSLRARLLLLLASSFPAMGALQGLGLRAQGSREVPPPSNCVTSPRRCPLGRPGSPGDWLSSALRCLGRARQPR